MPYFDALAQDPYRLQTSHSRNEIYPIQFSCRSITRLIMTQNQYILYAEKLFLQFVLQEL